MTTNPSSVASPPQPSTSAASPPQTSPARLIVLLILLGVAIGALFYDFTVAKPGIEAAETKLSEFVDERNKLGVKEGGTVTPADVHKELGMQPTWVDKHDAQNYEVEYYCWWGPVPVLNMRRHYLAVVYVGEGTRRISSHYKNERPPREALPILDDSSAKQGDELLAAPQPEEATAGKAASAPGEQEPGAAAAKATDAPEEKGK